MLQGLYRAFDETDASLAEINPLIVTGDGQVIALDAKLNFDANALFRHPDIVEMRDLDEEDPAEIEASKFDLSYISLDGNIGCLVNGAGLAMATMDMIKLYGGEPANFLDVGGGATAEKVTEAFKIMLNNPGAEGDPGQHLRRHHEVRHDRRGVIAAAREVQLKVPLVVRMKGTNEELGRKILADSGLADHHRRTTWPRRRRRSSPPAKGTQPAHDVDSHQQEHQGHHAGHHRQDRPVPHADVPRLRERQELLRRRRQSEEGRRGFRRHSDLTRR